MPEAVGVDRAAMSGPEMSASACGVAVLVRDVEEASGGIETRGTLALTVDSQG